METQLTPQTKWENFTPTQIQEMAEDDGQLPPQTSVESEDYLKARGDNFYEALEDGTFNILFA